MACDKDCTTKFVLFCKSFTSIFGGVSCLITFYMICKHMRHYTNPFFQKKIVVILFLIPFYSINAIIGSLFVLHKNISEIVHIFRATYEAMLILSFFQLIVAYVCYDYKTQDSKIERLYLVLMDKKEIKWTIPTSWVFPSLKTDTLKRSQRGFNLLRIMCMQYTIINYILSAVLIILYLNLSFGAESLKLTVNILKVTMLGSVFMAIYGLILYLYNFNDVIGSYKPFWKFFSIKIALFLSIWQQTILGLLQVRKWIILEDSAKGHISSEDYIDHLLVTIEMFILSVVATHTFSYDDFLKGTENSQKDLANVFSNIPRIIFDQMRDTFHDIKYSITSEDAITNDDETFRRSMMTQTQPSRDFTLDGTSHSSLDFDSTKKSEDDIIQSEREREFLEKNLIGM